MSIPSRCDTPDLSQIYCTLGRPIHGHVSMLPPSKQTTIYYLGEPLQNHVLPEIV